MSFSLLLCQAFGTWIQGVYLNTSTEGKLLNLSQLKVRTKVRSVIVCCCQLFADNAAVAAHLKEHQQMILDWFSQACQNFDLTISLNKMKTMAQGTETLHPFSIRNYTLEDERVSQPWVSHHQQSVTQCWNQQPDWKSSLYFCETYIQTNGQQQGPSIQRCTRTAPVSSVESWWQQNLNSIFSQTAEPKVLFPVLLETHSWHHLMESWREHSSPPNYFSWSTSKGNLLCRAIIWPIGRPPL